MNYKGKNKENTKANQENKRNKEVTRENREADKDILRFYKQVRRNNLEGFAITTSNTIKLSDKEVLAIGDNTFTLYTTNEHGDIVKDSTKSFDSIHNAIDILLNRLTERQAKRPIKQPEQSNTIETY